jgi:hypothetical protein
MRGLRILVAVGCLAGAGALRADVWDLTTDNDNDTTSNNTLIHGTDQVHDLAQQPGGGDRDWFYVPISPFTSYEVIVDGQTGDLNFNTQSIRRFNYPAILAQDATAVGAFAFTLRWANATINTEADTVQVRALACDTLPCSTSDEYRIRAFDTTYSIPRFNNSGTQSTLLLIQNLTTGSCTVNVHYFNAGGSLLATGVTGIPARGVATISTAIAVPGQSGSARVTHDCGYGGLDGKAVALEPATGFTFDTAMAPRPR